MNIYKQKHRSVKERLKRYGQKPNISDKKEADLFYGTDFWVRCFLAEPPQTWDWIIAGYMAFWCGREAREFIDCMFFRELSALRICKRMHISERTCYIWREFILNDFTGFAVQFSLAEIDITNGYFEENEAACTFAFEITDRQWSAVEKILGSAAVYRSDKLRKEIEAITAVKSANIAWRDMPKTYGAWKTVYNRYNELCKAGIWTEIEAALRENRK